MSITFHQIPDAIASGFNDLNFVVSSSQSHQTQFRYNTQIWDASGNTIASFVNLKQPTYSNLLFDAHRTVQKYLTYDISNLIVGNKGWRNGVNVFKKFRLTVIEEYPRLSFHASGTSDWVIATNSAMNMQDWINNGLGGRYAGNSTRKWMTNSPDHVKVRLTDSYELGTISTFTNNVYYLKIETYGYDNALIKTATIRNYNSALADDSNKFPSILCGPADLNASTLDTGTQTLITDATKYYRVAAFDNTNTQSNEWKYFDLDTECLRDGTYKRLFFLNSLGRFDAFNFNQVSEDSIEVEKSRYDKLLGVLGLTTFTYNTYQQKTSVFHSKVKQKYKLRSGFVDTDTAEWIKELIASPLVYILIPINSGNTWVACTVDETSYTSKKTITEKLFNIELTITLSIDSHRQAL